MIIETFDQALQLATEFLATKERKNYYESKGIEEPYPEYAYTLAPLSEEQVSQLRALKEKYGSDFTDHLSEAIDDEDTISDMFCGEPVDIDLDTIHHVYLFKIHELKPDNTVLDIPCDVVLTDEQYARLLAWHLFDDHLTICTLRQHDNTLYNAVMHDIDGHYYQGEGYLWVDNPYVATLDEAVADAETIVRQNNIKRGEGYIFLDPLR